MTWPHDGRYPLSGAWPGVQPGAGGGWLKRSCLALLSCIVLLFKWLWKN